MEISLNDIISGFMKAYARTIVSKNERDYKNVFFSLFETLHWVVVIDNRLQRDRHKTWYSQFGLSGNVVKALRFARNRVNHQWSDIVYNSAGAVFPVVFPVVFHEWQWRGLQGLPPPQRKFPDPLGETLYQSLLEHKPVRISLENIAGIFTTI